MPSRPRRAGAEEKGEDAARLVGDLPPAAPRRREGDFQIRGSAQSRPRDRAGTGGGCGLAGTRAVPAGSAGVVTPDMALIEP